MSATERPATAHSFFRGRAGACRRGRRARRRGGSQRYEHSVPLIALVFSVALGAGGEVPRDAGTADLEKRVAAAHRRAARAGAGSPEAKAVAAELGEIGSAYLQRSETGRAIELLEEAWGWNSEDGLVLARLTLAYVMAEDYSFARFYLDLAREENPRAPPDAYAVLGGIY